MLPNNNTLQPVLSETISGLIWKVELRKNGLIALESRNPETKQVSFSVFNFLEGTIHFKEIKYPEEWMFSLAFLGQDHLILQAYGNENSPENKGVIAVSNLDGSIIWQRFNVSLKFADESGLEVYDPKIQPRKYFWIDHALGLPVSPPAETITDGNRDILFPAENNSFTLPPFIHHHELVGKLLHINYAGKDFLSFHEMEKGILQQRLIVYQGNSILIDDILIAGIQKQQPEAFFIHQNHLFCIRNKQEIISYLV